MEVQRFVSRFESDRRWRGTLGSVVLAVIPLESQGPKELSLRPGETGTDRVVLMASHHWRQQAWAARRAPRAVTEPAVKRRASASLATENAVVETLLVT